MSINKIRNVLYKAARILGDINAVQKGKILQRIGRRIVGGQAQKWMNKWFR